MCLHRNTVGETKDSLVASLKRKGVSNASGLLFCVNNMETFLRDSFVHEGTVRGRSCIYILSVIM